MAKSKSKKAKSPAELLGLERMKMTPRSCRARAKLLRDRADRGYYKNEDVARLARRWASKYVQHAKRLAS